MGLERISPILKTATKKLYTAPKSRVINSLEYEALKRGVRKENIDFINDMDNVFSLDGSSTINMGSLYDVFTYVPKNFVNNIENYFLFNHRCFKKEVETLKDTNLTKWYEEILLKLRQSLQLEKTTVDSEKVKAFYKLISNRKSDEAILMSKNNEQIEKMLLEIFPSLEKSSNTTEIANNLKQVVSSKEYANLSDKNKFTIKIASIIHNLDKDTSAAFLNKLNIPEEMKLNIYKMRFAHNSDSLALNFTSKNERLMVQLYQKQLYNHEIPMSDLAKAENLAHELDKTGIPLFGTPLPKGKNLAKIPTVKAADGYEYHVLNLNEIKGDMTKYGFPGVNAEEFTIDATFLNSVEEAEVIEAISGHLESPWRRLCTTKIGLGQNGTFQNRKIGIPIEVDNKRRYQFALSHDLETSGYNYLPEVKGVLKKGYERELQRTFVSDIIKQKLNINDEQYAELFAQIADKRYLTQIKHLTLDGKELSQAEINNVITALKDAQKEVINKGKTWIPSGHDYSTSAWSHNETIARGGMINKDFILYKADNISQVDEYTRAYVRENNKYIILIKNSQENISH